jgi:hypothetical protein
MTKEAKDGMVEAGGALKDSLSSFFSKDLKGMLSGGGKMFARGFGGALRGLAAGGAHMKAKGESMIRGREAAGKGPGMMGSGLKAVGGALSKLGPVMNMIGKLGPLIGTIGAAVMALVKLFIDADSQVKQFNKDILQSASTVEYLGHAGGNVDLAFSALEGTLEDIREAAHNVEDNLAWGTNADTYKGVLNVLNQTGVSIFRIEQEAKRAGKTVHDFTKDLVHVSVAYSRAFGVPLQEINQLQSEMMTDMGMSVESTRLAFAQMTRAASESGIAANKFFAIIRGVSQDLSLYNVRMGDAVKMLKLLGKVMNPRNAQKFMQTAMRGLKDMGRQERIRMTMMAGVGNVARIVERDIKGKAAIMGRELEMSGSKVAQTLKTKGIKGLDEAINKLPASAQGAVREAAIDLELQQKRLAKGGPVGVATAARNVSAGGAVEVMTKALGRFTGGAKLKDIVGTLAGEMTAENLGISEEQLDSMAKLQGAMDGQREVLRKELVKLENLGEDRTDKQEARFQQLQDTGLTSKNIDQAGYDQIFNATQDGDKDALKQAGKVESFAKRQTDLQQSLLDKLAIFVDFFMNQFYNVIMDVWDVITGGPWGPGGAEKEIKRQVFISKDKKLMDALSAATSETTGDIDLNKYKAELIMQKGGVGDQIANTFDAWENMRKRTKEGKAGAFEKKYVSDAAALMSKNILASVQTTPGMGFDAAKEETVKGRAVAGAKAAGWSDSDIRRFTAEMDKQIGAGLNVNIKDALAELPLEGSMGIDSEARIGLLKKLVWYADPSKLSSFTAPMEDTAKFMAEASKGGQKLDEGTTKMFAMSIEKGMYPSYQVMKDAYAKQGESLTEEEYTARKQEIITKANELGVKLSEDTLKQAGITAEATADLAKKGGSRGTLYFKMPPQVLKGEYKSAVHDAMLDALRLALFEYYLYSDLDKSKVIEKLKSGEMTIQDFGQRLGEGAEMGMTPKDLFGLEPAAKKQQFGALITGIKGGRAMVTPPPSGEGFVAAKPGEEIVPAYARGGGGKGGTQRVLITLDPNAQQMFQAEVQNGIYEHERRKKFG